MAYGPSTRPALRVAVAILALAWIATPSGAEKTDRIHVAGTLIIGEVKGLERGRLKISTDYMGTVEADWEQVERVESRLFFEVEDLHGRHRFGQLVESGEDGVLAVQDGDDVARLTLAEIVNIYQTKPGRLGEVDFSISLGYSFTQATDATQASLDLGLKRRTRRFVSSFDALAIFSRTGDDQFTRSDVSYSALRNLRGRWTYSATAEYQSNESLGLDDRYLLKGSAVFRALRTDRRELSLGLGLAASREEYSIDVEGANSWEGVASLTYYAFHFDDPELEISSSVVAYPSLTTSGRYRVELDVDVQRELGFDLHWALSAHWSFDSDPVGIDQRDDLALSLSLGWSP